VRLAEAKKARGDGNCSLEPGTVIRGRAVSLLARG